MKVSEASKFLVFLILNVVIATCGCILLAFGAILQRDELQGVRSYAELSIGGFAIGMGVLIFTVASFGWGSIFLRKPSMLTSYTVLVIILFIIQIILGAIALGSVNNSKCELDEEMEKSVESLMLRQDDEGVKLRDRLQKTFRCCGVKEPSWWKQQTNSFPASCCPALTDPCTRPYAKGCAAVYGQAIQRNVNVIGGVAIGFSPVELVAGVLAWYLKLCIHKTDYYY